MQVQGGDATRRWIAYWAGHALNELDGTKHPHPGDEPDPPPSRWEAKPLTVADAEDPLLSAAAKLLLVYGERAKMQFRGRRLQAEVPTRLYRALLRPADASGWVVDPRCDLLTATPVPGALPDHQTHEIMLPDAARVQRIWIPLEDAGQTSLLAAMRAGKWLQWQRAVHLAREALAELQAQAPETPTGPALIVTYKAAVDAIEAMPEDERTALLGDTSCIRWASYPLQGTNAYEDCSVSITVGDMWEQSVARAQAILRTSGQDPGNETLYWPIATAVAGGHLLQAYERIRTRRRSTPAIQIHIGAVVPDRWHAGNTQVAWVHAGSVQAQVLQALSEAGVSAADIGRALGTRFGGGRPVGHGPVSRSISATKPTPVEWLFPLLRLARDRGIEWEYAAETADAAAD